LDNSLKFSEQGTIKLNVQVNQTRANKANLRFEVSDEGVGIPKEKMKAIFESFSQLETKGSEQGVGLGLSIVKGLLELMGSKIQVESDLGKGSKFYFDLTLKYSLDLASNPVVRTTSKKATIDKIKTDRKYKLLLVEDDERVQTVLFKSLMGTNLFYIDLINDGALVLETIINNSYDVILMDVDLPNVPGDQITKLIRDFPLKNIKSTPIIGITANAFEEKIKDYLSKGMNAVVPKPFDLHELVETVLKFLKK